MNLLSLLRIKVVRRFINLSVLTKKNTPYDEIIRNEMLVGMCFISLLYGSLYIIYGIFVGLAWYVNLNYLLFFALVIPSMLYLTKKGYYNQGKLLLMFTGTAFMVVKASSLGPNSGMNLAILIIPFGTFAFYSLEDYKYILLSLSLVIASYLFLETTNYSYLGDDQASSGYEYNSNLIATFLFCIFFFYSVLRMNQYMNHKLKSLNQKLVKKNQTLIKINRELDSYVYKASHDLRAPLTSLMGIVNLLKTEQDPSTLKTLVILQENCIAKMDEHIHQIINLSKNNKLEPCNEKVVLNRIVEECIQELQFFENAQKTDIVVSIIEQQPLYSDRFRLKIIVGNLISNAFKYYNPYEEKPFIHIKGFVQQNEVTLSVEDNGLGIPVDRRGKIFDMFYRGTEVSKGSGLGLFMVKEMLTKLKGSISVESASKTGIQFKLSFPNEKPIANS